MSYDETSAFTGWRRVVARMQRAGARKKIKRLSHKKDRRIGRRKIEEG
jgi:hypothetical protein